MSDYTLIDADRLAEAVPSDPQFYTKWGVKNSGIPPNRENIRVGLRFTPRMFKAIEGEFASRLQQAQLWGTSMRDHADQFKKIVADTVAEFPIPNFASPHADADFFLKALTKFINLINEARVKQGRLQLKRESTAPAEARPAEEQRISLTEKTAPASLSTPISLERPNIDQIQLVGRNDSGECAPVSLHRLICDSTVSREYWRTISYSAFLLQLRKKRFWCDTDENPRAPSHFTYAYHDDQSSIFDAEDFQDACLYWERHAGDQWQMHIHRDITGLPISLPYFDDEH